MGRIYIKCIRRWAGEGAVHHSAHVPRKLFLGARILGRLPLLGMRGLPAEPSQSTQGGVVCSESRSLGATRACGF